MRVRPGRHGHRVNPHLRDHLEDGGFGLHCHRKRVMPPVQRAEHRTGLGQQKTRAHESVFSRVQSRAQRS